MATFTWLTPADADWLMASSWSGGVAPNGSTADAGIAVAGSYTVGIAAGEVVVVDSATLAAAGAVLAVAGTLTLGGTQALLDLHAGVLALGGSLQGGTLRLSGGTLAGNGGTLDAMRVLGTLTPSRFQPVSVVNGLTVQTLAGAAPGSIDLTAGALSVLDSETLDQVAISLGSPFGALRAPAGGTLTLGPSASLTIAGGSLPDLGGAVLANQGTLQVNPDPQGFGLTIAPSLLNTGSMALAAGTTNRVTLGGGFNNSGSIAIGANATLRAGNAAAFANTGSIAIGAGATLELDQNTTLSDLLAGSIDNQGGVLVLAGTLALGGATLDVAATGAFANLALTGTVKGGAVVVDGGVLALPGATLDGIALAGTLDASNPAAGYTITVKNGLAALGAAGIDARSDTLSFLDSETLDDFTIAIGQTVANAVQLHYPPSGLQAVAGSTLTLGPATAVTAFGSAFVAVPSLVNHGSLTVAPAATLAFGTSILVNAAAIAIGAGGLLSVTTLANAGSIALAAGGTLEVDASATLPQLIAAIGTLTDAGGQLVLGGSIDLLGGTLDISATGLFRNVVLTGTVRNGTIAENGGTFALRSSVALPTGPTLVNVVVKGLLDLSDPTRAVAIRGGLAVQTIAGGQPGTINLSGGQLTVLDNETLDNLAISLGAPGTPANPVAYNLWDNNTGAALTLGHAAIVTATGNAAISVGSFVNLGFDAVGATQQQWFGQSTTNAGVVTLAGGSLLLAGIAASGNSGSIVAGGSSGLNLTGAAISNSGLLQAAASGTLTIGAGLANFTGTSLAGGTYEADAGATLDLSRAAAIVTDAATIILNGPGSSLASFNAGTALFQPVEASLRSITAGHTLSVLSGRDYATSGSLADAGLLQLGGGVFTSTTLSIAAGGLLRGFGSIAAPLANAGTVDAQGGVLRLGPLTGAGGLRVDPGGTLELTAATAAALSFNLVGGALLLDAPASYTGTLNNFAPGDSLLLKDTDATAASVAGNALNVTLSAGGTLHYTLLNPQSNIGASVTLDEFGRTDVELIVPPGGSCFLHGTRMLTAAGECPIEDLRVGDMMITLHGRRLARIVWVGSWQIDCARHPRPWDVHPVRVQAGAFGEGRPLRDLFLSPDHAVFVASGGADAAPDILVPIRYLLNGASVAQVPMATARYWHVELDRHDVLLAAGMPAESYLDTGNRITGNRITGNRDASPDAPGAIALHPDFARRIWSDQGCAPLVIDGPALATVRRTLLARAAELGHRSTAEPDLRLQAGGRMLHPRIDGPVAVFTLPPGTGRSLLLSRAAAAADLDPDSTDRRPLGVAVAALRLDGCAMPPDRHGPGWYPPEAEWQWTDGAAELDCSDAVELEVTLLDLPRYWSAPEPKSASVA